MSTAGPAASGRLPRRRVRQRHRARPAASAGHAGPRPVLRVSGVLRSARGRLRLPGGDPRADRGRPARTSGATRRCCRCRPTSRQPQHGARLHPAAPGGQPRPRARHRPSCGSRTTPTNPTNSFKDRVVAFALSAPPASSAARCSPARAPATSPTRSPPPVRGPASRPWCSSRTTSSEPKTGQPARSTPTRLVAVRRQLRRRQPARLGDRGRGGRLGVRQRQRPAVLRRGLQDPRLRDRRAARLAAAGPDRDPGGVRARS